MFAQASTLQSQPGALRENTEEEAKARSVQMWAEIQQKPDRPGLRYGRREGSQRILSQGSWSAKHSRWAHQLIPKYSLRARGVFLWV